MKSRRCEIVILFNVLLENWICVSGCQEGSMLSSSIAAETHVKVRSDQIKYSPHAFENFISDIETRPGPFNVLLENLICVSGCQEGSMLSSSIAAETHVKVRSDQIKYSPHAFENFISDIETRPGPFNVLLENLICVSGCQEGSMLSSSIAADTHVKVRSYQIKYSPHAFENFISDIETRPGPYIYIYTYTYTHKRRKPSYSLSLIQCWARW